MLLVLFSTGSRAFSSLQILLAFHYVPVIIKMMERSECLNRRHFIHLRGDASSLSYQCWSLSLFSPNSWNRLRKITTHTLCRFHLHHLPIIVPTRFRAISHHDSPGLPGVWTTNHLGDLGDVRAKKVKVYSITEHRVPELIPVLSSQPAGDVSHKPDGRLPLLSARPTITLATLRRAATNFAAWWTEARWVWTVCLRMLLDSIAAAIWNQAFCAWVQHANHQDTEPSIWC